MGAWPPELSAGRGNTESRRRPSGAYSFFSRLLRTAWPGRGSIDANRCRRCGLRLEVRREEHYGFRGALVPGEVDLVGVRCKGGARPIRDPHRAVVGAVERERTLLYDFHILARLEVPALLP